MQWEPGTLETARFFVARADEALRGDRTSLRHYLEAAIVFARSVTFHIQKEFKWHNDFDPWYSVWRERLEQNPLAKYFLGQRNFVLKKGHLGLAHEISIPMGKIALGADFIVARVVRGTPWYRRSPRIIWQDAVRPWRELMARRRAERERTQRRRARQERKHVSGTESDYGVRFVDAPVEDLSATELLSQYLDTLEKLVADAENRFMPSKS